MFRFRNCKPRFRVLTPTMYRSRMASTRQTLSMDCSSSIAPSWAASKPQEKLIRNQEDSLDLELGASASHVDKNQPSRPLVDRLSERSNGELKIGYRKVSRTFYSGF